MFGVDKYIKRGIDKGLRSLVRETGVMSRLRKRIGEGYSFWQGLGRDWAGETENHKELGGD